MMVENSSALTMCAFEEELLIIQNLIEILFESNESPCYEWEKGHRQHFHLLSATIPSWVVELNYKLLPHTHENKCQPLMSQSFVFLSLMTSRFNTKCYFHDDGEHWITFVTETANRANIDVECWWKRLSVDDNNFRCTITYILSIRNDIWLCTLIRLQFVEGVKDFYFAICDDPVVCSEDDKTRWWNAV